MVASQAAGTAATAKQDAAASQAVDVVATVKQGAVANLAVVANRVVGAGHAEVGAGLRPVLRTASMESATGSSDQGVYPMRLLMQYVAARPGAVATVAVVGIAAQAAMHLLAAVEALAADVDIS